MSLFQTSLIGGGFLASLHTCWVMLVALVFAQAPLDHIFKLHILSSPFHVQAFDFVLATELIGVTFLLGYFYGAIFYIIKSNFYPNNHRSCL